MYHRRYSCDANYLTVQATC